MNLLNSICHFQEFHGVENILEEKHDENIYNGIEYRDHVKNNKKIKNQPKNSKSKKRKPSKRKLFRKSNNLQPPYTTPWRPKLNVIYGDKLLLDVLITHTTKSYNVENVLFLQCIEELKNTNGDAIDSKIISIYNLYINPNASYQINLSSACFCNILSKRDIFSTFSHHQKRCMFDLCAIEIEQLIVSSILPSFYRSAAFKDIASKSKYYGLSNEQERKQTENVNNMVTYTSSKIRSFSPRSPSVTDGNSLPPIQLSSAYADEPSISCITPPENVGNNVFILQGRRSTLKMYKIRTRSSALDHGYIDVNNSPFSPSSVSTPLSLLNNSETEASKDFGCIF